MSVYTRIYEYDVAEPDSTTSFSTPPLLVQHSNYTTRSSTPPWLKRHRLQLVYGLMGGVILLLLIGVNRGSQDGRGVGEIERIRKMINDSPAAQDLKMSTAGRLEDREIERMDVQEHAFPRYSRTIHDQSRYLSYTPHSGDHNQHGELLNALVLSRLLNRTLLLPPARLGSALAWSSDLEERMSESESCKTNATAVSASDCDSWTNVNFNFLLDPQLLQEFNLVDRWNASSDWLQLEYDLGGMGISPEEMRVFEDRSRRSYRFYDDSYDADGLSRFDSRINLDDLINDEAKLLKFGSLFGPQRIKLTKRENLNLFHRVRKGLIFRNERLNAISEGARVLMGHGYVGVHLRTRDGVFRSQLTRNLQHVFTSIICDVFKLSPIIAQSLLDRSTTMPSFQTSSIFPSLSVDSSLRCSRPLYTNKEYFSLNRPIYIATDARHPRRNPALSSFFNTFPCVFILDDFLRRTPYNTRPLKTLVEMRDDKEEYKSRWDGLGLARFLYPFLEAEIVAKGSSVVGTTGSSFSRYAKFILSPFYKSDSASAALSVGPTLQSSERVTDVS